MLKTLRTLRSMDLITENRLARRAAILTTARQMIADLGYDAITVRDLAEACRVSVPTLYNQFGGKDKLLAAAIEEHFLGDPNQTRIRTKTRGIDRIFAILDHITNQFLESPAFHRRILEAFASLDSTSQVQERITVSLGLEIDRELQRVKSEGCLPDWADPGLLASQITTAFVSTTVVWASGAIRDDQLLAGVQYSTGLVLLGVTNNELRLMIETRIIDAQKHLLTVDEQHQHTTEAG
jgi:AcrR family transcriptional regulator